MVWQAGPMDVYRTRRDNLRRICGEWGGPTSLAKKLGHSNGSYLAQLIGPNPSREVSEKVAREIEGKLTLPTGWLDQEQSGLPSIDDEALAACVRVVAAALDDLKKRPQPSTFADVVQLVYEHRKLTGRLDEAFIQRVVRLLK
jgi:hypothetical protein